MKKVIIIGVAAVCFFANLNVNTDVIGFSKVVAGTCAESTADACGSRDQNDDYEGGNCRACTATGGGGGNTGGTGSGGRGGSGSSSGGPSRQYSACVSRHRRGVATCITTGNSDVAAGHAECLATGAIGGGVIAFFNIPAGALVGLGSVAACSKGREYELARVPTRCEADFDRNIESCPT